MSGATFTASANPTVGLQGYDLERKVKHLVPATSHLLNMRLLRAVRNRRAKAKDGTSTLKKDIGMPDATLQAMVDTLSRSVTDIVGAGGDDRDELLAKSFTEFTEALTKAVGDEQEAAVTEALAKMAPEDADPLFKGLGTVGRIGNLVSRLSNDIAAIKDGKDWYGITPPAGSPETTDKPSEEVEAYLDYCLAGAELAMRAAVNEHVEILTDDDPPEGMQELVVKSADGADIRVKTALPEELAKFATHPDVLDQAMLDQACGVLLAVGVEEAALNKLFEPEGDDKLTKLDPNMAAGAGGGVPPGEGAEGEEEPTDMIGALHIVGRCIAAALVQLDGVLGQLQGDVGTMGHNGGPPMEGAEDGAEQTAADEGAEQGGSETGAEAGQGDDASKEEPAAGGDGESDEDKKKKNPFAKSAPTGTLAKVAPSDPAVVELQKQVTGLTATLEKLMALPQVPRAVLGQGGKLEKAVDNGGDPDAMTAEAIADVLEKIDDPVAKAEAIYKIQRRVPPSVALAKFL